MKRFLVVFFAFAIVGAGFADTSRAESAGGGAVFSPIENRETPPAVHDHAAPTDDGQKAPLPSGDSVQIDMELANQLTLNLFKAVVLNLYPPLLPDNATDEEINAAFQKFVRDIHEGGISVAVNDPNVHYLSPKHAKSLKEVMRGGFDGGIGLSLTDWHFNIIITRIVPNSPAYRSGDFRPGDMLLEVDGNPVAGKSLSAVVDEVRGAIGTEVTIKIRRGNKEYVSRPLMRDRIVVPMVNYESVDAQIAYIQITHFSREVAQKFLDIVNEHKKDQKYFIIDLRGNPGGLLNEVDRMSCFFANRKEYISTVTMGRGGEDIHNCEAKDGAMSLKDLRVVVLVNGFSASASEIFSGVLQDWHKATIVGEQTSGKGSVQAAIPLPFDVENGNNGGLDVTIAEYLVGNNRVKVNKIGIKPNKVVHNAPVESNDDVPPIKKRLADPKNDRQLAVAIKILRKRAGLKPDVSKKK